MKITRDSKILLLGSCFTTEVGARLEADGYDCCINPTGNVYNPLSAERTICNLEAGKRYDSSELVVVQGLWRSLDHHTRFAAPTPEEAIAKINQAQSAGQQALESSTHIIITFGTAWVFERNGEVVCNCHKLPAREFVRRRLSVDEIVAAWQPIIDRYPQKSFIFTVSPIRHLADGLHGNQLSKSTLLLAIDALKNKEYFPAFETLIDELRDYSWYADDKVHPSHEAVNEVYRRLQSAYL
ncbi:MAG: GSCFA domain-containing protein [Bacteroides sp.]|nr:GSCFA domain-containing protein [Bacteroides sp.]MCM1379960.1 GSCFA domain-containing protein [Bacteroides sp.]MCM1446285.1 GSCFA domain-containing protein [Prevotella sp.]